MANRLLGVDYGSVRVGLAVATGGAPEALTTLPNDDHLIPRLRELVAEHHIETVVVGLPRGAEGESTKQSAIVRRFVSNLETALSVPVALQDEFATTAVARERLAARKQLTPQQRDLVDQEAAVIILEDYLG